MKYSEQNEHIFEFESPVEFVLVATKRSKRAVVAKSKGAKIDLVCYSQQEATNENNNILSNYFFYLPTLFFPPLPIRLDPLSVDSMPVIFSINSAFDRRASELTLVWRGAATKYMMEEIKKKLEDNADDIVSAIEFDSEPSLEWALSAVIDECHKASARILLKRSISKYAFWFTISIYVTVISISFLVYLANWLGE